MSRPTLCAGSRGPDVMTLQRLLFPNPRAVDGDFGPATHSALSAAQSRLGLNPDGVCGPATWDALAWLPFARRVGPTPYRTQPKLRGQSAIEGLVLHYTASPYREGGINGADPARIERWLSGGGSKSSTHLAILRDGQVLQGCPFTDRAWHAPGVSQGRRLNQLPWSAESPNAVCVGVDLENVGHLRSEGASIVDAYGGAYKGPEPFVDARGKLWEPYTPEQIASLRRVMGALRARFPVISEPGRITTHAAINVGGGRVDPGPALNLEMVRSFV